MTNIVIIGAGPAGLTAAYELLKNSDLKPIILESSSFIGGISRTVNHHGNLMDLGGHRFFTKNKDIMALWTNLMPLQGALSRDDKLLGRTIELAKIGPDPETTDRVMLIRRRVSRIYFLKKFFDYPISLTRRTIQSMGLRRTLSIGLGMARSSLVKRKEHSLEDFYINRFGKPLYRMFFEDYTQKVWGVHPSQIAPDWGSQRVKGLSMWTLVKSVILKPLHLSKHVETSLIEQFYYPKFGPGQLYETMASEIVKLGGTILTGLTVIKVKVDENRIVSLIAVDQQNQEHVVPADVVFSSMAIKDLVCGMNEVPPHIIRKIAAELPYRDFITVGVLVNKLAVKNDSKFDTVGDIVPDCWIYVQDNNVKMSRFQIFNNWSPYLVKDLENTVWLGLEYCCDEHDALWQMDDPSLSAFAVDEICTVGFIQKQDILDTVTVRVKKAYPAYFGSYSDFHLVKEYLDSIDNLYCIGRNGQHRYNNMDHSMLTAIEGVKVFLHGGIGKKNIWNVNTEGDYQEISKR